MQSTKAAATHGPRETPALRAGGGATTPVAPGPPPRGARPGFLAPDRSSSPDEASQPTSRGKPGRPPQPETCHVLLIEDDPATLNALRVLLTMHGCTVAVARSLEQGLDLLRANPTAIVVDLMLPDGDGIEILARVREAKLPSRVIVMTAVGDPTRLADVYRLKPECVLRKPLDLGELLRAIGVA